MEVWGPLGNGFPPAAAEHLVMVAGGIGQTPFLALARSTSASAATAIRRGRSPRRGKVTLCYGCRSEEYLAGVEDFRRVGVDVRLSTDDGSAGHRGLVTDLIAPAVDIRAAVRRIVCCGPEAMLAAAARLAERLAAPCQVSLETPDGLRHRHLLQLRGEDPRRRRALGLSPDVRRGAGL